MNTKKSDLDFTLGYVRSLEEKSVNQERHIYRLQEEQKYFRSVINTLENQIKELKQEIKN